MARKLYFNKAASDARVAGQGGTSGLTILLIFVPVLAFMLYSKRKGRQASTDSPAEEEKREKKDVKEKKKEKAPNIVHSNIAVKDKVDPEWEAIKAANPNNPFYQSQPMPEGWTGESTKITPVYKMTDEERAKIKGVAKPYKDGKILPYPNRTEERIHFITDEGKEPVNGLGLINPYSSVIERRPVTEYNRRDPETACKGPSSSRSSGKQTGSKSFYHMPLAENKGRFIELTNTLAQAPVSMSAEDLKVLLGAVEIVSANPDPTSPAFAMAMREAWNDLQGTYPTFIQAPLAVIEKYIKDAMPELLGKVSQLYKIDRHKNPPQVKMLEMWLKEHMGLSSVRQVEDPKVFLLGWFFDHFRLWDKKHRIYINGVGIEYDKPANEKLKGAYQLMTWLEVLGQSCAQTWILSRRGFDFPGLTLRFHNQPLPPDPRHPNRIFDMSAAIFLPTYSDFDKQAPKDWIQLSAKSSDAMHSVSSIVSTTRNRYEDMCEVTDPNAYRSLIFRPGWSIGAVLKTDDLETAFEPGAQPKGYVDNGKLYLHEWEKGTEASPGALRLYRLYKGLYLFLEPEIVRFSKRAQYSWSPTLSNQTSGFRSGQIAMCLESLSTILAMSSTTRDGDAGEDNHSNKPTFPKYLDFGDNLPLETETKDGVKTYSFPSLRDFHALERIYIPYVSLAPKEMNPTPQTFPESTATLALHQDLGLYKQLDEKRGRLQLVVICKDGMDPQGKEHTAEDWCGRLELELRMEAKKLDRKYEDYKDVIKWIKDDGVDPNRKEPMALLSGNVAMWRVE